MKKMRMLKFLLLGTICIIGFYSCNKDSDEDSQADLDDAKIHEYLNQHSITASKDAYGVYYEKLMENESGQSIEAGKLVALRYKISTLEGTLLEDLIAKDSTVLFRQGTGDILPLGLDFGISLMKTHEKYRFYIPSYLAFGDYSNGNYFPFYTNFIVEAIIDSVFSETDRFETEEDSIESFLIRNHIYSEKFASGLFYSEVTLGSGDSPLNGYRAKFYFTRKTLAGKVLYTSATGDPATIVIGSGEAVQGLEEGLQQMREGGKATLFVPSKIAFGASVRVLPSGLMNDLYDQGYLSTNVSPYETLIYEVELLDVY